MKSEIQMNAWVIFCKDTLQGLLEYGHINVLFSVGGHCTKIIVKYYMFPEGMLEIQNWPYIISHYNKV